MKDFKVKCVKSVSSCFSKGKIYKVIDGLLMGAPPAPDWKQFRTVEDLNNWFSSQFELVEDKPFTKDMLKTGMRVECKDGDVFIVLKDVETSCYGNQEIFFAGTNHYLPGTHFSEDLKKIEFILPGSDIVKVYDKPSDIFVLDVPAKGNLLWQRFEVPKMTHKELESLVGHEFEYVKE
jgi:hypothetical protein